MTSEPSDKSLKNYLYDNPSLRETKCKKASDELDDFGPENEVWLFQCPKNFDPKKMMCSELAKIGKQSDTKGVDCSAERFSGKKTFACIAPEKAAEYELICDNVKMVRRKLK